MLYDTGQFEAAIRTYQEAVPIYEKVYGEEHPEFASGIYNLGRVLLITGKLDAAESYLRRALTIDRQRLAPGHEDLILPLDSVAMLEMTRGNSAEVEVLLDEALASAREHKHWMLGQVLTNVADLNVRQRRLKQAGTALDEARVLLVEEYGDELAGAAAWRLAILDTVAGSYEIEQGRFPEAEQRLTAAWPVLHARFGPRSYFGDQCLSHLGRLDEGSGQPHGRSQISGIASQQPYSGLTASFSFDNHRSRRGFSIDSAITACLRRRAQAREVV